MPTTNQAAHANEVSLVALANERIDRNLNRAEESLDDGYQSPQSGYDVSAQYLHRAKTLSELVPLLDSEAKISVDEVSLVDWELISFSGSFPTQTSLQEAATRLNQHKQPG